MILRNSVFSEGKEMISLAVSDLENSIQFLGNACLSSRKVRAGYVSFVGFV